MVGWDDKHILGKGKHLWKKTPISWNRGAQSILGGANGVSRGRDQMAINGGWNWSKFCNNSGGIESTTVGGFVG